MFGPGQTFNINDYAPVDPTNEIPGFGLPIQQSSVAPPPMTSQQTAPPPLPKQPGNTGAPVHRSQSSSHQQNPPAARSVRTESERRHVSTEEMRKDFDRAPKYIPTPINGNAVEQGQSTEAVSSESMRSLAAQQQTPSFRQQQSNIGSSSARPPAAPPNLPNLPQLHHHQPPIHPPQFAGQPQPNPSDNQRHADHGRPHMQHLQRPQGPPPEYMMIASMQRQRHQEGMRENEVARKRIYDMLSQLSPEEKDKIPTFIEYVDNCPFSVCFKGIMVDTVFIVDVMRKRNLPISNKLRCHLPPGHELYINPNPQAFPMGPNQQFMFSPEHILHYQRMQQGAPGPPMMHPQFHAAARQVQPQHHHQQAPGMVHSMQPNQMRHNMPQQVAPQGAPNMIQRIDNQQNQMAAHQFAPPGQMNPGALRENLMHPSHIPQEAFGMDPRMAGRFPVRILDRNQLMPPQQQQQCQPQNINPAALYAQQSQSFPQLQSAPPNYAPSFRAPVPQEVNRNEMPQQPDRSELSNPMNINVYPIVSADQEPPPSAFTPRPRLSPTESSESQDEPADTKPLVHRTDDETNAECNRKPLIPRVEKPVEAVKAVDPETSSQRKPQKKSKQPIEVITIEDDEPRRTIKQEVLDEQVSSSSTVLSSLKQEPSTSVTQGLDPDDVPRYSARDFENYKKMIQQTCRDAVTEMAQQHFGELVEKLGHGKVAVQEPQVTTSLNEAVSPQRSRSPSSESIGIRPKRRKQIVDSDDEERYASRAALAEHKSEDGPSTSKGPLRRKARPPPISFNENSDDEMPVIRNRRKKIVESEDDEYEEEKSPTVSSFTGSAVPTDDEEDSLKDFVVSDDYDSDEDRYSSRQERISSKVETPKQAASRNRPSSRVKSESREKTDPRSARSEKKASGKTGHSETSAQSRSDKQTEEQKEAFRMFKNLKARKTREENREKKHKADLERMEQTSIRRTRATKDTVANPRSPVSEALQATIAKFQETTSKDSRGSSRKKEVPKSSQSVEKKREEQSSSNKRPKPIVNDTHGDSDGVHVPAKRMAHSNSSPAPSKIRPPLPASRNRPNHSEMMSRRDKEAAENRKRDEAERDRLKRKPHLTYGEKAELSALEKKLGHNNIARVAGSSSSTPSTSVKRVVIKQEPRDAVPEKKRPPPDVLEPTKATQLLSLRKQSIARIFNSLVENNVANAAAEAQKIELEIVHGHPVKNKYTMRLSQKLYEIRRNASSGVLEVNKNAVSHDRILSGGAKENCTVANKPKKNFDYRDLTLHDLHPHIIRFKLTRAELEKNAYPLFKSNNKVVEIAETTYTANKKMFLDDHDNKRVCSRCSKEFRMNDNGTMIHEKDICRYHNRAIVREGKKQTFSKRWQCCNEEVSTNVPGCKFSDIHVFDQLFKSELGRFIPTPAPSSPTDSRSTNAFALDCEMVYTLRGPALARLTMVDMKGKQVLDVFIKPPSEVIDANTEFSGLTMEQVESAKDTLQTCHKKLFKYVNSETILIGHSLESDLKAMRIVHTSVIDTAIMFSGADHKKALKKLSSLYLGKSIQGDNEDAVGHDSLEDAMTCVNLIYHGLKNPETVPHRSSS